MHALLVLMLALLASCTSDMAPMPQIPAIPAVPLAAPVETLAIAPQVVESYGPQKVARWGATVRRESQAVFGINAPSPMFLGQIHQESGGDEKVTASDFGRGLAQFMDATARQVAKQYPELGAPDPYSATWSIRAMVRLNQSNWRAVRGDDDCEHWGAALVSFNAGAGWVRKAQKQSDNPGIWFGETEKINSGQSAKNFKYSRLYAHWIIEKHQPKYRAWGNIVCENML